MASPQIENGYTKIANDLLAALAGAKMTGSEFMIALVVITKTYGWNKIKDSISLTQFQEISKMDRKSCARTIKTLVARRVLGSVKGDTSKSSIYWIQKDYDLWITSGVEATNPSVKEATRTSGKRGKKLVASVLQTSGNPVPPINTKDTTKDTKQKTIKKRDENQSNFDEILVTIDLDIKNYREIGMGDSWIKNTYINLGVSENLIDKALSKIF